MAGEEKRAARIKQYQGIKCPGEVGVQEANSRLGSNGRTVHIFLATQRTNTLVGEMSQFSKRFTTASSPVSEPNYVLQALINYTYLPDPLRSTTALVYLR